VIKVTQLKMMLATFMGVVFVLIASIFIASPAQAAGSKHNAKQYHKAYAASYSKAKHHPKKYDHKDNKHAHAKTISWHDYMKSKCDDNHHGYVWLHGKRSSCEDYGYGQRGSRSNNINRVRINQSVDIDIRNNTDIRNNIDFGHINTGHNVIRDNTRVGSVSTGDVNIDLAIVNR
jgi:hypothetical protein